MYTKHAPFILPTTFFVLNLDLLLEGRQVCFMSKFTTWTQLVPTSQTSHTHLDSDSPV